MKKQFIIFLVTMGILSTIFVGCGKEESSTQQPAVPENSIEAETDINTEIEADANAGAEIQEEAEGENKTFSGKLEEKRDMLFIISNDNGEAYSIGFETAPEGYDELKEGDAVVMEYTGELSVVDAFTGEVISLKLAE